MLLIGCEIFEISIFLYSSVLFQPNDENTLNPHVTISHTTLGIRKERSRRKTITCFVYAGNYNIQNNEEDTTADAQVRTMHETPLKPEGTTGNTGAMGIKLKQTLSVGTWNNAQQGRYSNHDLPWKQKTKWRFGRGAQAR